MSALRLAVVSMTCLLMFGVLPVSADDPLLETLEDEHARGFDFWIYNDIPAALRQANAEGNPLFVTFRCIPCEDCSAFDAEVAQGADKIADIARNEFIPVRQVEMEGVDLSLFQFDHDLNWAAMFVNADGVVYGRYGTQSAKGADAYNSTEGLKNTMQRVLELHANYPDNIDELRGKRPEPKPYKTALEMPGLENKERFQATTTRKNCIHCHNIHDAENVHAAATGTYTHDMLYRYPLPENVGLVIDADHGIQISEVLADSPAAEAGLQVGENLTHVNGQAMTSIADMQWVLHHLPNEDTTLTVRGSETGELQLDLTEGWKKTDFSWRGSLWSASPRLRVWLPELKAEKKRQLRVDTEQTAFEARWINTGSPSGRAAKDAGLKLGDVIVAIDGKPFNMTTQQFQMHLKLNYEVGEKLPVTVLRDGKRVQLEIPLVE